MHFRKGIIMKKENCRGCYNDNYNYGLGGAKQCWSFDKSKKLESKYVIHKNLAPPYEKHHIRKVPPCYKPQDYAVVSLNNINEKGYWR